MGVGAGQQEFDRHDSGDMASVGRRQAGAQYSAGGRQGGTSKKLIPSCRRARWPPRTRPPGPARPPSRPGFPGCSGPAPLTDEGQRPRVAVGPTPTGRPLRAAVVALPADQPQPRWLRRRPSSRSRCQVACRVHGFGVRSQAGGGPRRLGWSDVSGRRPLLARSAPSYDLGSC